MSTTTKKAIKAILFFMVITILGLYSLFELSARGIIWSPGEETVVSYNISLIYDGKKLYLYSDYLEFKEDVINDDNFLVNTVSPKGIEVVAKNTINFFLLSFVSSGKQGGSNYFDATPMTDIYVNGKKTKNNDTDIVVKFQINLDNHPVQEFDIVMKYRDKYLFAKEQILRKKLIVNWVDEQEFKKIRQEKLKIRAKE